MRNLKAILSGVSIAALITVLFISSLVFSCNENSQSSVSLNKPSQRIDDDQQTAEIPPNRANDRIHIDIDSMSDCLLFSDNDSVEVTPDMDCMFYTFSNQKLRFSHVNSGFNCCPEIDKAIEVRGDSIFITEIEVAGYCDCLCLFDLNYTVSPLEPGTYFIHVTEPYVYGHDEILEFTIDLVNEPSGEFCITRDHYPWGLDYQP